MIAGLLVAAAAMWAGIATAPGPARRRLERSSRPAGWSLPALGCVVVAVAGPAVTAALALVVAVSSWWHRVRGRSRRRAERVASLIDVVDAMGLGARCAMSVSDVVAAGARRPVAAGRALASARARHAGDVEAQLAAFVTAIGPAARPVASLLVAASRYGTPMTDALDRVQGELRRDAARRGDRQARRLSVVLLFPLVLCILPAFALVAIVPVLLSATAGL